MSRMLSFIDTEMEQMICFNSDLDIETLLTANKQYSLLLMKNQAQKTF